VVAGLERAMGGLTPGAGASGELRALLSDVRTALAVADAGRARGLLEASVTRVAASDGPAAGASGGQTGVVGSHRRSP
jgi:hypothetical protein